MEKGVLLLGSYGQTNLGDDLLMYNLLDLLETRGYERIIVNVSDKELVPPEVMDRFADKLEIHETYGTSPLSWVRTLLSVDTVVYGGGTIFKDLYSSTGRGKHSVVMRIMVMNVLARLLGKKVYHMFIGIGSIRTAFGRFLTKISLNAAEHTYFRDKESYNYARKVLGINTRKVTLATDGIFLNTEWGERDLYKDLVPEGEKWALVGVNALSDIPDWVDRDTYIAEMRTLLSEIAKQDSIIVFLPFQTKFNPKSDLAFIRQELLRDIPESSYIVCDDLSLSDLKPVFEQLDYFVGMRFHSLLASTIFQTPFIALEYDTKCTRLMQDMRYPHSVLLEKFTSDSAVKKLHKLSVSRQSSIEKQQSEYVDSQKEIMARIKKKLTL